MLNDTNTNEHLKCLCHTSMIDHKLQAYQNTHTHTHTATALQHSYYKLSHNEPS